MIEGAGEPPPSADGPSIMAHTGIRTSREGPTGDLVPCPCPLKCRRVLYHTRPHEHTNNQENHPPDDGKAVAGTWSTEEGVHRHVGRAPPAGSASCDG